MVDLAVVRLVGESVVPTTIEPSMKREIIEAITGRVPLGGEQRTLFDVAGRLASSLAAVFLGERATLLLPKW